MTKESSEINQFLKKLTEITEANLTNEQFGVSELAKEMGMSRSSLHRKVMGATKTSVSQFIRQYRLKTAMEMLQKTSVSASEVAYKVGFGSVTYFTKCFGDYYGFPPGEVGKRNLTELEINVPQRANKKRLILLISTIIIFAALIALFLILYPLKEEIPFEKSIAVLPFIDDSPEDGNTYIINGLREEILNKLEKINDLKVVSRTTTEIYRDSKKSIHNIADELQVNYILEGSGQKIGNKIKITLQLIEAETDKHLWSNPYIREVTEDNIFQIQEDVAFSVAKELKVIITAEEKEQVAIKPTENLTAYHLYLKGLELGKLKTYSGIHVGNNKAKTLFEQAIKLDTTFAEAYGELASIYINNLQFTSNIDLSELYLDSGLTMINKTLFYDKKNAFALSNKINYYVRKGMFNEAKEEFANQSEFRIKDYIYYREAAGFYCNIEDYYNSFINGYKYLELKPKEKISPLYFLSYGSFCFAMTGFPEISIEYLNEILIRTNNSLSFKESLAHLELYNGNFKSSLVYCLEHIKNGTTKSLSVATLSYFYLRDFTKSYEYLQKLEKKTVEKNNRKLYPNYEYGYLYLLHEQNIEANYHFDGAINRNLKQIELNRPQATKFYSHFELACIYSAKGEKSKALKYLQMLKKRDSNTLWMVNRLKFSPMLDNIRDENEFKDILKEVEAKFLKEHNRIKELLKEYGESD